MAGVRHKLFLLYPGPLHRAHRPAGQQDAQHQKGQKRPAADQKAAFQQAVQGAHLAGYIGKHDVAGLGHVHPQKPQPVVRQQAAGGVQLQHLVHRLLQKIRVGQIVVAAPGALHLAVLVHLQHKIGQAHAGEFLVGYLGPGRIQGNLPHGAQALPFQAYLGQAQHRCQHAQQDHRHDAHGDADKLDLEPPDHPCATSR